jgi:3-phenylpropionate/cinnamic acid dioxygenase small subunit
MTEDPSPDPMLTRVNRVLTAEAVLLDAQDYSGWLAMWDARGLYIVPTAFEPSEDYARSLNFIYDDADMRQRRVQRLESGASLAMSPPTRTVRTVSLVRLTARERDAVVVESSLLICASRMGIQRLLACQVEHRINLAGVAPRLLRKVVRLVDADTAQADLTFLL